MLYLNADETAIAEEAFDTYETPNLSAAAQTLTRLIVWTNANSDGWSSWPKPVRAAKALQTILSAALTEYHRTGVVDDTTGPALKRAYTPIKAFLTREQADHSTVIVLPV